MRPAAYLVFMLWYLLVIFSTQKATKAMMRATLQELLKRTGCVGTLVLAAPNPEHGTIDSLS